MPWTIRSEKRIVFREGKSNMLLSRNRHHFAEP